MKDGIEVTTTPMENGQIMQEVYAVSGHDVRDQIMRRVINTQEQQIRDALIALGWTPPNVKLRGAL